MEIEFVYNDRLGISLPQLYVTWEELDTVSQAKILAEWEDIRGRIPERVIETEKKINQTLASLTQESDFNRSCELNHEMAELASIINDLWIWFRIDPSVSTYKASCPRERSIHL
ncbi:hypothetical protein [Bacillus solitudinis]|uniref:hypothetical protein n=1 Tax=Bacillus solitudinis TaxID=2014074 RepID=UPI000C23B7AF|nr:hypothetical protein [Bacillus solitudinis]